MKKSTIFAFNLAVRCKHNEIFERAAALTLRVLLAFFPFIIFLMALMGRMDINGEAIIRGLYGVLPAHVSELVEYVLHQLTGVQNAAIMSAALFFLVYNITRGFRAVLRSTNMAYGVEERRGLGAQIGLSFVLMLLFAAAVIIMLGILVFGWQILSYIFPDGNPVLFFLLSGLAAMVVLFMFVSFIYKLACATPHPAKHIFPGAAFTVVAWVIVSAIIGFITQNFSQFPVIYGSIAGVFVLILWLNSVSVILLLGNELNALLHLRVDNQVRE